MPEQSSKKITDLSKLKTFYDTYTAIKPGMEGIITEGDYAGFLCETTKYYLSRAHNTLIEVDILLNRRMGDEFCSYSNGTIKIQQNVLIKVHHHIPVSHIAIIPYIDNMDISIFPRFIIGEQVTLYIPLSLEEKRFVNQSGVITKIMPVIHDRNALVGDFAYTLQMSDPEQTILETIVEAQLANPNDKEQ